jgi:hypothetical protein
MQQAENSLFLHMQIVSLVLAKTRSLIVACRQMIVQFGEGTLSSCREQPPRPRHPDGGPRATRYLCTVGDMTR